MGLHVVCKHGLATVQVQSDRESLVNYVFSHVIHFVQLANYLSHVCERHEVLKGVLMFLRPVPCSRAIAFCQCRPRLVAAFSDTLEA